MLSHREHVIQGEGEGGGHYNLRAQKASRYRLELIQRLNFSVKRSASVILFLEISRVIFGLVKVHLYLCSP